MFDQGCSQHDLPHSFWCDVRVSSGTVFMHFQIGSQLLGRCFQSPVQLAQALQIQALFLHEIRPAQIFGQGGQQFDLTVENVSLLQMQRLDQWW